ncbi:MAG: exosortase A [Candidatus Polarisedimenticolaceae bacterium]|nr:exosortase A [Candidatus Polarisedimenticolaceae bacterium]
MSKAAQKRFESGLVEAHQYWRVPVVLALGVLVGILALYHQTAWSMISIWLRSDTFAHGFLILPISAWLIWDRRKALTNLVPKPEYRALVVLFGVGFLWLLGDAVDALVVQQLALVFMLISGLWVVLGNQVCLAILFPLLFLLFAVPMGEELVPSLMEFTADFTVKLIQITGIPVYREGLFFSLPSGEWSVVEACSGIRYLIASITLGSLFAYLTYSSMTKRLIFMVAAIIVPIFANGMRAYIIVMLGHFSDMTVAVGVDHLIYGWVFFGVVMLIMFSVGAIWRDPEECSSKAGDNIGAAALIPRNGAAGFWRAGVITLLAVSLWPLASAGLNQYQPATSSAPVQAPVGANGWQRIEKLAWSWEPEIIGADSVALQFYRKGDAVVSLFLWQFLSQKQGAELVSSQNLILKKDETMWRSVETKNIRATLKNKEVSLEQSHLKGREMQLLVWRWYRVGSEYTANNYAAKLLEAKSRLMFGRRDGAIMMLAAPFAEKPATATAAMQDFLDEMLPEIELALDQASGEAE